MKKILSVLLAVVIAVSAMSFAAFADEDDSVVVCSRSAETVNFIFEGGGEWGDIHIVPAVLTVDGADTDIYLVALRGTGISMQKTNNIISSFQSAFNKPSAYLNLVRQTVLELIPEGAKIVFTGHSLGGMVEQQLICEPDFTAKYEILNTLTAGSPYIMTDASLREGTLIRLADKSDIIPHLSPATFLDINNQNNAEKKDGGYGLDLNKAHNESYINAEEWAEYDALGVKGGNAVITFSNADVIIRLA